MSILRSLARPETRGADPRIPWGNSYIPTNSQLGLMAAGVPVTDDRALALSTVFTCISIIVDAISAMPITVLRKTADHTKVPVDPLPALIQSPDPEMTLQ